MNKVIKTILIISIAIFGAGVLFIPTTQATEMSLVVEFEETPLFDQANFLPGDSVTRWVKVTNNSGETQEIGIQVTGSSDCTGTYCLSDSLDLVISQDSNPLYTGTLTDFYNAGETYLSALDNGVTNQYDFSMTFKPDSENNYQGLSTNFNFKIGFWGESIGPEIPPSNGGGGGGVIIAGLIIFDERVSETGTISVTITWNTNKKATSRVIYSSSDEPYTFDWTKPPDYGYSHSTPEYDTPAHLSGVTGSHTVYITDLLPGITYYYRCVSHTSPDETVSTEHSFTTLGEPEEGVGEEEEEEEEEEEIVVGEQEEEEEEEEVPVLAPGEEEEEEEEEEEVIVAEAEEEEELDLARFLAAIGTFFGSANFCWLFFLLILILTALFLLSLKRRLEKDKTKKRWIWPLAILALVVLYCIFCCTNCWLLILIISIMILLFLLLGRKKEEKNIPPETQW